MPRTPPPRRPPPSSPPQSRHPHRRHHPPSAAAARRDAAPAGGPPPERPTGAAAPPPPRPPAAERGTYWLHGLHAVAAALANPARRLRRLLLTGEAEAALAARLPPPWRIAAERAERNRFQTFLPEDAVHQGAALLVEPLAPRPLERAVAESEGPVLLLDQVTDPRNVGAILRSAAGFGAACVVLQDRHAPPETGALARAASGALELVPVVREVNLARALLTLKRAGFWAIGLEAGAPVTLAQAVAGLAGRRAALVLGGEEAGLRRLQRETCDELARLPVAAEVESLNVSAAAAVALYELARR